MRHEITLFCPGPVDGTYVADRVTILDEGTGEGAPIEALLSRAEPPVGADWAAGGDAFEYSFGIANENRRWISVATPDGEARHWPRAGLADRFLGDVTRRRLEVPGPAVRLHAAALADAAGRSVVLIGASGAGKSTLAAHLVCSGLDLITDEQLEVHGSPLSVAAFTRPIVAKPDGRRWFPVDLSANGQEEDLPWLVPVETLGGRHRVLGVPVLLVELDRQEGGEAAWDALSPGSALCSCAQNSLDLVRDYEGGFEALAEMAATVPAIRLRYSRSSDAAATLVEMLRGRLAGAGVPWSVGNISSGIVDGAPSEPSSDEKSAGGARLVEELVTVDIGDETVVARRSTRALAQVDAAGAAVLRGLPLRAPEPEVASFLATLRDAGMLEWDESIIPPSRSS